MWWSVALAGFGIADGQPSLWTWLFPAASTHSCGLTVDLDVEAERARVAQTIRSKSSEIKACYDAALQDSRFEGRVAAYWTLDEGVVSAVRTESTLPEVLQTCIAEQVEAWSFEEDLSGEVSWPFVFKLGI